MNILRKQRPNIHSDREARALTLSQAADRLGLPDDELIDMLFELRLEGYETPRGFVSGGVVYLDAAWIENLREWAEAKLAGPTVHFCGMRL